MPPPPLSSSTIVSFRPKARGRQQPADVVRERHVADQQHDRASVVGGRPEGRGDGAVDAVGAAVAQHARRVRADRPERLDVAHGHRGGDEQRRVGGQQHAQLRGDPRL